MTFSPSSPFLSIWNSVLEKIGHGSEPLFLVLTFLILNCYTDKTVFQATTQVWWGLCKISKQQHTQTSGWLVFLRFHVYNPWFIYDRIHPLTAVVEKLVSQAYMKRNRTSSKNWLNLKTIHFVWIYSTKIKVYFF